MTDRERDLEEILARLEKQRPEIDRIFKPSCRYGYKKDRSKKLCRIPPDMDFTVKDGNTEYEVAACSILTVMNFCLTPSSENSDTDSDRSDRGYRFKALN